MSTPVIAWLVVGLITVAALIALAIGLVRHAMLLGRTARRFQEEVQPLTDEITAEMDRASSRTTGMGRDPHLRRG